ncbi:hypothetical protein INF35_00425 [Subdoligranulum sp. DSM 109015]|uniref:Uncharacterized protein n=1 Tax=Gemmiger gallinarum TaxID=2779354 RepID=A0ABR9QZG5_9FIRM|nr:hypothetical protein [Gemmiger gallinarum]MBE5036272.1 hypothetical protein [Gemmiger gallinarum]
MQHLNDKILCQWCVPPFIDIPPVVIRFCAAREEKATGPPHEQERKSAGIFPRFFCQALRFYPQRRNFQAERPAPPGKPAVQAGNPFDFTWFYYIESRHFLQGFSRRNQIPCQKLQKSHTIVV